MADTPITNVEELGAVLKAALAELRKVIIGQDEALELALVTVLVRGHALVEGVPGVAKTLMVKTLTHVLGCDYGRVQFTPDLMPADILGTSVYDLKQQRFELVRGAIFTTFLLADEINRAPAKTQSALLEAMQERQVTLDRSTHTLDANFTVFATQNPVESEGTYPLAEAQKDRFLFLIRMDYPGRDHELGLAERTLGADAPEAVLASGAVQPVLRREQLAGLRKVLEQVQVRRDVLTYCVDLVRATRSHEGVLVGAGPRATQALLLAARAVAALDARGFVTPDDVKAVARPVLSHRIVPRPEFEIEGLSADELVTQVVASVPVPR
jgi:MoxR-like ATPase